MAKLFLTPVTLPAGSTAPTPTAGDNSTKLATTAYVDGALSGYVPTASYTAADVLSKLLTVDGASSGIDADLLDGQHGSYYLDAANLTGTLSDARLSSNVALLNASNTFTESQTIKGASNANRMVVFKNDSDTTVADILGNGSGGLTLGGGGQFIRLRPNGTGSSSNQVVIDANGFVSDGSSRTLGYREAVMVNMSGNVTLDDTHSGKTFYNGSGASYTITIPTGLNGGMMFQVITRISGSAVVLSRSGTSLYWYKGDGTAANANRTVGTNGWATLYTTNGTAWFITGVGIT